MSTSNINMLGDGFISEGIYNNIKIMGSCNSIGNIKANEGNILGDARFKGDLEFEVLKVNGSSYIEGNLNCKELKVNGSLIVKGSCNMNNLVVNGELESIYDIECNNVVIRGGLKCKQSINSQYIKSYGELVVDQNISSEEINIQGSIYCKGLLNAEQILITPRDRCRCNEIGSSKIEVIKPKGIFKYSIFLGRVGSFSCNLIEADTIDLENSRIKDIRGKDVKLINNCEVDYIEYIDMLEVSSNSTVKNSSKVL